MICASRLIQGFQGIARYLATPKLHREDRVRVAWMEGRNMIADHNLRSAAREMEAVAAGSVRVVRPGLHLSVSWAPEDDPTRTQMTNVFNRIMSKLNLQDHQAMLVAHGDEPYAHVHALVNRVHPIHRRVRALGLYYREIEETLRHAEREMNFRETPGHYYQLPDQSPPDRRQSLTKTAHKATQARGEIPFQVLVQDAAERDFDQATSWEDLHTRLHRYGLKLVPRRAGLVITDGHEYAKCSSVAQNVSLRKLEARFGEPWRSSTDIKIERQIQKFRDVKVDQLSPIKKRSIAREFNRLIRKGVKLEAQLGHALYDSLKTLVNDERQRGDRGV